SGVATGACGLRDVAEIPRHHRRAPDAIDGDIGCLGDRIDEHAFQCALPELAVEEPLKELLLVTGRSREETRKGSRAISGGAFAADARDGLKHVVDVAQIERWHTGGGDTGGAGNRRVTHADASLSRLARQEG